MGSFVQDYAPATRSIGPARRTLYREPPEPGYRTASQSNNPGEEGANE